MGNFHSKILTPHEVTELFERSLRILEQKGVTVNHERALEVLEEAGATVDRNSRNVRFPRKMVEEALRTAPRSFRMAALNEGFDVTFPPLKDPFYSRPGTGARSIIDDRGTFRDLTMDDVVDWTHLVDNLSSIDFTALPSPAGIPGMVDIHTYRQVMRYTNKHIWVQPYSKESVPVFIEMAKAVAGGSKQLQERPLISMIVPILSPLAYKEMDVEEVWQCALSGVPIHASSLPTAGSTSPFTLAGTVLIAAAEIIGMLVMAQVFKPGAPVIANGMMFRMDMSTGAALIHTPEALMLNVAFVQFIRDAIGIPIHTFGFGSDGNLVDAQSQIERAMHAMAIATAGVSMLGGAGQLEVATTLSPLQLVIDDEISMMLKREVKGTEVNDETLAWDEIMALPPGGNFVESMHTLEHCRECLRPISFLRLSRPRWMEAGAKDLYASARETLRALRLKPRNTYLPAELENELDTIVNVHAK